MVEKAKWNGGQNKMELWIKQGMVDKTKKNGGQNQKGMHDKTK